MTEECIPGERKSLAKNGRQHCKWGLAGRSGEADEEGIKET